MKFSLINVSKSADGLVDGNWIQNVTGTLDVAIAKARATERANSGKITVAVVNEVYGTTPHYRYMTGLRRLD